MNDADERAQAVRVDQREEPARLPRWQRRAALDPGKLLELRNDFREGAAQAKLGEREAEMRYRRLTAPLRVLQRLFELSRDVLVQPSVERRRALRSALSEIAGAVPSLGGSRQILAARTTGVHAPGPGDCGLLPPDVLPTIYLGTRFAALDAPDAFSGMIDVISGMSLHHSALEAMEAIRVHDGVPGLGRELSFESGLGDLGPVGLTPDPEGPQGGGWGGWGGWGGIEPPRPPNRVPSLKHCVTVREVCEEMLVQSLESNVGDPPALEQITWADNISSIELLGTCSGDKMIIRGSGFGIVKPPDVDIVMEVAGACQPVPTDVWTNNRIEVTLPVDVTPGPVGFVDHGMLEAFNGWVNSFNARWRDINKANKCLHLGPIDMPELPLMGIPCPPDLGVNYVIVGKPLIHAFLANAGPDSVLEPGESLVLQWNVENADEVVLTRLSGSGPTFGGNPEITDPPGTTWDFGPAAHTARSTYRYRLTVKNSCGQATRDVAVQAVSTTPILGVEAMEVTQGIQTMFHASGSAHPDELPDNVVRLVAGKDTVVRVYVSSERPGWPTNTARVTGVLLVNAGYYVLAPIQSGVDARPFGEIDRWTRDHTLNFLIPGAGLEGITTMTVYIEWTEDGRVETVMGDLTIEFHERQVLPVRYVRLGAGDVGAPSDSDARHTVERGFDFLPSAPLDIAPASKAIHNSEYKGTSDLSQWHLYDSLRDAKECAFWEWGEECDRPDEDLIWVGVTAANIRGIGPLCAGYEKLALVRLLPPGAGADDTRTRVNCGHEIGHLLDLGHVEGHGDVSCVCCGCDELPHGGVISDACFDIYLNRIVPEVGGKVVDYMSYYDARWISNHNWTKLYWNIGG